MSAFDKTGVLFSNIILQQALRRIAEESASANIKKKKKKTYKEREVCIHPASSYLICRLAEYPRGTIPHRWLSSAWLSL